MLVMLAKIDPAPPPAEKTEIQKCVPVPSPLSHSTTGCWVATLAGLIQVSIVKPASSPTLKEGDCGMRNPSSTPSSASAGPTNPLPNAALPSKVPVLVPTLSDVFPSNPHQPTSPGRVLQDAFFAD